MITYKQITKSSEIASISEYYVLDVRTTGPNPSINAITSISLLRVEDDAVVREAVVRITSDSDSEAAADPGYYRSEQVAESMSRFLLGQIVISEPIALQFLRELLETYGYDGEIRFVPVTKLVTAIFPEVSADSIQELARQLDIPETDNAGLMRTAYFEHALFRKCRIELGASVPPDPVFDDIHEQPSPDDRKRFRISNRTLKRWAKSVWSVSPWVVVITLFLLVLVFVIQLPRKENTVIDREAAPNHYLVLSWNSPGKYGTKLKAHNNEEAPIAFRVPYGVYSVLNNNSIPVELTIVTEESKSTSGQARSPGADAANSLVSSGEAVAAELSSSADISPDDADEDTGPTKITMRPNSTRQITIDTDQYLTLSEDANNLILFYVSEVPDEKESDTTGHDNGEVNRVVYAYVKGTEVRFRKSPSLEGAVIDSMQNGQQVQVLGVTGEWTHVAVQKEKGYIFSQFLTSEDPTAAAYEAKKAEEAASQAAAATAADSVPADTGPNTPDVTIQNASDDTVLPDAADQNIQN